MKRSKSNCGGASKKQKICDNNFEEGVFGTGARLTMETQRVSKPKVKYTDFFEFLYISKVKHGNCKDCLKKNVKTEIAMKDSNTT